MTRIPQRKAQGPSRTCDESKEEEEQDIPKEFWRAHGGGPLHIDTPVLEATKHYEAHPEGNSGAHMAGVLFDGVDTRTSKSILGNQRNESLERRDVPGWGSRRLSSLLYSDYRS